MLWWHILICIISIHRIVHFVRSQDDEDDDEEEEVSTTIPLATTTDDVEGQSNGRTSSIVQGLTISSRMNNGSEQDINLVHLNESSKQRIIIALAVLCAALAVILGFLVSIIVCQWLQHDRDGDNVAEGRSKTRPDFVGSSYNYHDHAYRQAIKL